MNLAFYTLRDNLLTVTESETFSSSELMRDKAWLTSLWAQRINEYNEMVSVVSSAQK